MLTGILAIINIDSTAASIWPACFPGWSPQLPELANALEAGCA